MDSKKVLEYYVFSNYLTCKQKFNNSEQALEQTKFALKELLQHNNFDGFTRTSNISYALIDKFRGSSEALNVFVNSFIDIALNSDPENEQECILYDAMYVTVANHNKNFLISTLSKVILGEDSAYRGFSRYSNNDTSINYRKILIENLSLDNIFNIMLDTVLENIIQIKQLELHDDCTNIENTISNKYENEISNFKINPIGLNLCRDHILNNKQQSYAHAEYSTSDLYACMDVGNVRSRQEDSVLLLTHPKNPDFKMLVVADGCGGCKNGNQASSFIVRNIMEWFEKLPVLYFKETNTYNLYEEFNRTLHEINSSMYNNLDNQSYSTFVGAIVNEKNTIISNVGDSRAYIYANGKLQQLTEDHNLAYNLWKNGQIKEKDDIRFHKKSNIITQSMGSPYDIAPYSTIISNDKYSTLILCSDGVTDCLSDNQLKAITRTTNIEELSSTLIQAAKNTNSHNYSLDKNNYKQEIQGGKDNASIAIFDNSHKKDKDDGSR